MSLTLNWKCSSTSKWIPEAHTGPWRLLQASGGILKNSATTSGFLVKPEMAMDWHICTRGLGIDRTIDKKGRIY